MESSETRLPKPWVSYVVFVAMMAPPMAIFFSAHWHVCTTAQLSLELAKRGERVVARVVQTSAGDVANFRDFSDTLTYQYTVADVVYKKSETVPDGRFDDVVCGDTVLAIHLPEDPTKVRLNRNDQDTTLFFLVLIDGSLLICGIVLAWRFLEKKRPTLL
ncbi:MAG: DUF3592 domain-containing protein [Pseudomonadota bacterium]